MKIDTPFALSTLPEINATWPIFFRKKKKRGREKSLPLLKIPSPGMGWVATYLI